MAVLKYRDPGSGDWVELPTGGPDEVVVSSTQPSDADIDLWIDPAGTWAAEFATKAYVDGSWTVPTLLNGWIDYGSTYSPPGFRKVGTVVYIKGLVKNGTLPSTVFTLPVGYRPNSQLILAQMSNSVLGRMDIYPNGNVTAGTGVTAGWLSICCSFVADG